MHPAGQTPGLGLYSHWPWESLASRLLSFFAGCESFAIPLSLDLVFFLFLFVLLSFEILSLSSKPGLATFSPLCCFSTVVACGSRPWGRVNKQTNKQTEAMSGIETM